MHSAQTKSTLSTKGSILIWTLLLGALLTTAFLFFIIRFTDGRAFQQQIMQQANQRQYLQSMMGYLKSLSAQQLEVHKSDDLSFYEGEITGRLTNEFEVIQGVLDIGEQISFSGLSDEVAIFWNRCDLNESGKLQINQEGSTLPPKCHSASVPYDRLMITTLDPELLLELSAAGAPLHYAIKSTNPDTLLQGQEWLAELRVHLSYGRTIELVERFVPSS